MTEQQIGELIKKERKNSNLTQAQLAEMAGMKQQHVLRLEKATHSPTVAHLQKVLDVFNLKIEIVPK